MTLWSPNQGTMTDTQKGIPLRDLEQRWNIGRNPVKRRAEFLGVKLLKPDYLTTLWPLEHLQLGDDLQAWIAEGNQMKFFPPIYEQDSQSVSLQQIDAGTVEVPASTTFEPIESQTGELAHRQSQSLTETQPQAIQTGVVVGDIREQTARLSWALEQRVPLTEEEFAWVCMVDEATLKQWKSPQKIRPGLTAHRSHMGAKDNRVYFWKLRLADRQTKDQSVVSRSVAVVTQRHRQTDSRLQRDRCGDRRHSGGLHRQQPHGAEPNPLIFSAGPVADLDPVRLELTAHSRDKGTNPSLRSHIGPSRQKPQRAPLPRAFEETANRALIALSKGSPVDAGNGNPFEPPPSVAQILHVLLPPGSCDRFSNKCSRPPL